MIVPLALHAADWPQWRGPLRNGVLPDSPKLLDAFPNGELKQLWDSEEIPSNDEGGLSSVVAAGGRAVLSVVWTREEPSETRQINELVVRQLGHQSLGALTPEIVKKMEETRASLSPAMRGKKLDDFTQQWIAENLDKKQKQLYSGYIANRFKKGPLALPLDVLDKLAGQQQRIFANDAELRAWLDEQQFSDDIKKQVLDAVPPTRRVAEDTVICLDLATGKTLWKTAAPGEPTGRASSSTPCIADGRVFALGSVAAYAVDLATGKALWSAKLPQKGPGSSPLAIDGAVVINAKYLFALDPATGRELWKQEKAGGGNSSPAAWKSGDRTFIICNGRATLDAVDAKTGAIAWSVPGAGDSTPAIAGDILAVQSRKPELGLIAYRLKPDGAEKIWNAPYDMLRTQSSPVIHNGYVFLADNDVQQCFDLTNGSQRWSEPVPGSISSPVLADGKLFTMINSGNNVQMLRADGAARTELGKANVKGAWVPSPTIADGKLLVRMKDRVRCFS
ncbi:MAG TPA: PQQ-binding-like beta-propeller repeat protein, partial [Chthoniobacteraceae bacterium]|nr:PQQ-binding-like beta-propeller repeat protein [Chthoniobacteraceae bacterium]